MLLLCPLCAKQYEKRVHCPTCKVTLVPALSQSHPAAALELHWSRNAWLRVGVGVVLAQGLSVALHHFLMASVLAVGEDADASMSSMLLTQLLQLVVVFAGGLLASAGLRKPVMYGAMVGVWNGILTIVVQNLRGEPVTLVAFYVQPILHTVFGAVGGALSGMIWKPLGDLSPLAAYIQLNNRRQATLAPPPVHWGRIFAGVALAVAGTLWADALLDFVLQAAKGTMTPSTSSQQIVLTLEISLLAAFLGGGVAGSNTETGWRQGFCAGLFSASILAAYALSWHDGGLLTPIEFLQHQLGQSGDAGGWMALGLFSLVTLALSMLGGSFGAQILPPVARRQVRVS
jgi:hypothetical protein